MILSSVNSKNSTKFLTQSKLKEFNVLSDETEPFGGTNLAPNPMDLLNASLSSCTAMYLRYVAEENKIDIGEIDIRVKIVQTESKNFEFKREIRFEHSITKEQKELFMVSAAKTPVTRVIAQGNHVETKIY